ncbi:ABC transporter substrate-binding protein [Candidatus Enterococcus lowellii]|jgi:branched-chain amino acid transport system substrate-binding protein|nr:ABC transporter substrate-binding protein [Enterococcus sp. DIV2402]MBO0463311.1 ABC transporter substrate-binding protein [Enterococcus sp. DIV2402]
MVLKKRKIWILMFLFLLFFNTACSVEKNTEEKNEVSIGVLVPLNGAQTQAGKEVTQLLELIEDVVNRPSDLSLPFHEGIGLPNLNGVKIRFVIGDSSTPDIAMVEAERLITEENVIGLTGLLSSSSTKTIMVPAERYEVVLLGEGTSETLTDAGYEYFGRTYPGDDTFIEDTFSYLREISNASDKPINTVALVSEDSEFGANIALIERKWLNEYDFELVEDISYSALASNVTSEVLRIRQAKPDAVIMSSYIADALLFMSTFREQDYFPSVLFGQRGGFASSDFVKNLGEDANYVFSTARWNTDMDNQAAQDLAEAFQEYSDGTELIGDVMAVGWNAYLLAIAANQAGSTESDAIRAEMRKGLDVAKEEDPSGLLGYQYDETGQNQLASAIIVQVQDMEMVTVYPEALSMQKEIYPSPNWRERKR